jgi:endonuclease YncB( thermonuclease family)
MSYRIAKGFLTIDNKSPDGDTITFSMGEEHRGEWIWPYEQTGRFPKFNKQFQANIRFEAIDALELHYQITGVYPGVKVRQPLDLARQARDRMLGLCGFDLTRVTETANLTLKDPDQQKKPATIAYREIDPYGRLVAFVFAEEMDFQVDDSHPTVFLQPEQMERSVNAQLLREGLVYPTFYGSLYPELRKPLAKIAQQARGDKIGIWKRDVMTFTSSRKPDLSEIEEIVILPKIFRRLSVHIARNGALSNFKGYLAETSDVTVDTRLIRLTGLQSFVSVKDEGSGKYSMKLLRHPEELIFQTS